MNSVYTQRRSWRAALPCLLAGSLLVSACDAERAAAPPAPAAATPQPTLRLATFNVAMGMDTAGELARALQRQDHPRLRKVAEILQRVRPDILLLNEFDYDTTVDAGLLLNDNYLGSSQNGQEPIRFDYQFRAPVNTGVDSGLDLDGNGVSGEPQDAWGYGHFAGQYGMLVLSRFPINARRTRTFQNLLWSDLPGAHRPLRPDGGDYYPEEIWRQLRLSSKSHWDVSINVRGRRLHLLAFHPTPPVFDGPEDRNGLRNFDEIALWARYLAPEPSLWLRDDLGRSGGLAPYQVFVIAGDFNADPVDGDALAGAVEQLLQHPRINSSCTPASEGGRLAAQQQAGVNLRQQGDPAADTADFDDQSTGNLRLDFLLPDRELAVSGCGLFWPAADEPGAGLVDVSDHRLVWLDVRM
jgi:endonuclease/exonuclease/phosphatase family metal-dependent hydrolase